MFLHLIHRNIRFIFIAKSVNYLLLKHYQKIV